MTRAMVRVRSLWLVLVVAALVAGCAAVPSLRNHDRTLTVQMRDAAGLFSGNDVGVLGVRVGEVTKVRPAGNHVDVTLRITDDDVKIPADVGAVVVSRSVATDRYVELTPVYRGGPQIAERATIVMDRTRTPVEFDDLMASVSDISKALSSTGRDGEQGPLGSLLRQSAETLDGQGASIRDGLDDLADVLGDVDGSLDDAEGTVENVDTLTQAIADDRDLVKKFTSQVATATTMLDGQKEALGSTFDALTAMVRAVARFVRDHQGQASRQLDDFLSLATTLNKHQKDLEGLLDNGPLMLQNLIRAIDDKDRLTFRTRPLSLVPGKAVVLTVCHEAGVPESVCGAFGNLPVWKFLEQLAGVRDQ